jgi:hypothetical protein
MIQDNAGLPNDWIDPVLIEKHTGCINGLDCRLLFVVAPSRLTYAHGGAPIPIVS